MAKVYLLSLGCPKNLVDSQGLLRKLGDKGMVYTPSPEESDILVVNTCGFIEEAKRESIEEILRIAGVKKASSGNKKLIVYGCLAKRFGSELKREIPEIDALWGVGSEDEIVAYCESLRVPSAAGAGGAGVGTLLDGLPYAYLKIAEGCDRGCAYCVIPEIRGRFRSRDPEDVLVEAGALVRSGAKELIVIAQDITSYGKDLGGYDLTRLLREIGSMEGEFWIRLLYLYPTSVDEGLLELIASEEKVCNYIDMPLQHSGEKILKLMRRGGSRSYFEKLIRKIRRAVPDVSIRTTLIVGFPGETDEDFDNLSEFVRKMEFDRLGAFTYSREEGTPAARFNGQVTKRMKTERYYKLMEIQSAISLAKNKALIGKTCKAIVEEIDGGIAVARLSSQAPEIDGVVFLEEKGLRKGTFVDIRITEAFDYDLKGTIVK
ncbi:MAG: 30S ribosomal protein S12 methylthiotransferase RimO [Nitrospiraceae bacterium]|nr:30S ribosomal protein S12 methylthiotransferase RimO [Nitrospiraceae bacterium]